jgi:hypothetical protein
VLWKKAYLPDGYNYIIAAFRTKHMSFENYFVSYFQWAFPDKPTFQAENLYHVPIEIERATRSRPIYPLLTSFGLNINLELAPLIFPILSWFILIFLVFFHVKRTSGQFISLLIILVLTSSFYLRLDIIGTSTDGLAALFCYLIFYLLNKVEYSRKNLIFFNLFLLLALMTRPLDPIFLVLFVGLILFNLRNLKLVLKFSFSLLIVLTHLILIQLKYHQLEMGSVNTGGVKADSLLEYLFSALLRLPKIIFTEFAFLAVHDIYLLLLVIFSIYALAFTSNRVLKQQFFLVFLGTFYLASLNGTIGGGFRYELPILMIQLVIIGSAETSKILRDKLLVNTVE